MESISSLKRNAHKRFKWGAEHDNCMLREILNSELWFTRPGSKERGHAWKNITRILHGNEDLKFDVKPRGVRERFQILFEKRQFKISELERLNGVVTERNENERLLDNVIELFTAAGQEQMTSSKGSRIEFVDEIVEVKDTKLDESRLEYEDDIVEVKETTRERINDTCNECNESIETWTETRKITTDDCVDEPADKRAKTSENDAIEFLNEKLKIDVELRKEEMEMRRLELMEKARMRELKEKHFVSKVSPSEHRNSLQKQLDEFQEQLKQQNKLMMQIITQQQQQNNILMSMMHNTKQKDKE